MALQHRRTTPIHFNFQRLNDVGMVVSGVMNTVADQEVEDATAVFREQLTTETALVFDVHAQQVEQRDPLRVHVFFVVRGGVGEIVRVGGRSAGCNDR